MYIHKKGEGKKSKQDELTLMTLDSRIKILLSSLLGSPLLCSKDSGKANADGDLYYAQIALLSPLAWYLFFFFDVVLRSEAGQVSKGRK